MSHLDGYVTMKGNPLALDGDAVRPSDEAPDFAALDSDLNDVSPIRAFAGKVIVLVSVPSVDTSVCSTEARRFNEEAVTLGDDMRVVALSCDLPFAQKRWCAAEGVKNITLLSDHRDVSFGRAYGVLIRDLRLLARAVFVVDRGGVVRYRQLVREIGNEPDYDEVLAAVAEVAG